MAGCVDRGESFEVVTVAVHAVRVMVGVEMETGQN
jgi:hypothetical protein